MNLSISTELFNSGNYMKFPNSTKFLPNTMWVRLYRNEFSNDFLPSKPVIIGSTGGEKFRYNH